MTISESNIDIQIVHQVHESITEELIRNAILIAYREANRTYEFNICVNIRIVGNNEGLEINSKFKISNYLVYVLMATVCDVMPLRKYNRLIAIEVFKNTRMSPGLTSSISCS